MSTASIGQRVEEWACYGIDRPLTPEERKEVIDYAIGFEECSETREELEASDDTGLLNIAYWAMADYARGQM